MSWEVDSLQLVNGGWFPLTSIDISIVVKSYLDSDGRIEPRFKNNTPGPD